MIYASVIACRPNGLETFPCLVLNTKWVRKANWTKTFGGRSFLLARTSLTFLRAGQWCARSWRACSDERWIGVDWRWLGVVTHGLGSDAVNRGVMWRCGWCGGWPVAGAHTGEARESSGARHPDGEADSEHLRIGRARTGVEWGALFAVSAPAVSPPLLGCDKSDPKFGESPDIEFHVFYLAFPADVFSVSFGQTFAFGARCDDSEYFRPLEKMTLGKRFFFPRVIFCCSSNL